MTGRRNPARDMEAARAIARQAASLGGAAYYVGGFVRDRLLGREKPLEEGGPDPDREDRVMLVRRRASPPGSWRRYWTVWGAAWRWGPASVFTA